MTRRDVPPGTKASPRARVAYDPPERQRPHLRWVPCAPDETVVLAHVRGIWAGVAQKPSDIHAVFACQHCHDSLDGRRGPKPPAAEVLRAMIETQTIMLAEGIITVKGAA